MTETIKIKVTPKSTVKGRMDVRFPANVVASNFLTVTRSNGTYTFGVDYTLLDPSPITSPSTGFLAVLDQSTGSYKYVSISSVVAGGGGTPGGTSGQVQYNNSGSFGGFTFSGDATLNTTTGALTLATVNANVGSFGSATAAATFTVDGKGRLTAAGSTTVTPALGSITGLGTGVATALGINIGLAGAFVTFNGALGTPSSGTLTSATGLPILTGVSGLGTGVATFLATPSSANLRAALTDEVGTGAAYFVGGALGTPASGTATNLTGLPVSTGISGAGTGILTALGVNVGTAGSVVVNGGALGTPSSGTATNLTGLPTTGLTGTLAAAQFPALTGDVTTSAGALATTIGANKVTNAMRSTMGAYTFKGNNSGATANEGDVDIALLTAKASPASTDLIMISDQAASGAWKKATISSIASAGSVSSIAGNTGAFTLAGGVTNSTNQIQLDGNYTGWAISNCTLAASVSANILTVALKDNAGNDASATSPIYINYRSATAATGTTTLVAQTAALSITTNATGATLGSSNSTAFRFWVVVFNNAGTNVLALINCSVPTKIFPLDETQVASTSPISGAATVAGVFFSPNGTTVTSKAFRILGYIEYNSTGLTTAGTYATGPNFIQTFGPGVRKPGEPVQVLYNSTTSSSSTTSSTMSASNNTLTITPTSAVNLIKIQASTVGLSSSTAGIESVIRRGTSTNIGSTATLSPLAGGGQRNVLANLAVDKPNTAASQAYTVYFLSTDNSTSVTYISTGVTTGVGTMVIEELMG